MLLGFAGAFRRSELVSLDVADLQYTRPGLMITLRRSKTDQEAAGRRVGVPFGSIEATCPVGAVQAWLEAAGNTSGPIFRPLDRAGRMLDDRLSDKAVARLVKRRASAIGLDPKRYAGHSLRAGLATSAAAAGASERSIMAQTAIARCQWCAGTYATVSSSAITLRRKCCEPPGGTLMVGPRLELPPPGRRPAIRVLV